MMDRLAIEAAKAATGLDWPDVGAALLMDVDGPLAEVEHTSENAIELARRAGAIEVRRPRDEAERMLMWKGRKSAFAAVGRISPNYFVQDGVIPRSEIARVLREIDELAQKAGLRVANVFHAGDGNLHPLVLYDARVPGQEERGRGARRRDPAAVRAVRRLDHGRARRRAPTRRPTWRRCFGEDDLDTMGRVRCAFDPEGRLNPGKVFPTPRLCGDRPGPYRAACHRRSVGPDLARMSPAHACGRRRAEDVVLGVVAGGRRRAGDASRRPPRSSARPRARRKSLLFAGGGTDLDLGARPERLDVLLRTRRLSTAIVEHAPSDQIVVVEAGVTLAALAERAGGARPAARARSAAARARDGRRRRRGQRLRAAADAVRVGARPDHRHLDRARRRRLRASGGGKVVKNVAGFDCRS